MGFAHLRGPADYSSSSLEPYTSNMVPPVEPAPVHITSTSLLGLGPPFSRTPSWSVNYLGLDLSGLGFGG
jgi:hypothetical protein